jgi:urea transport system permease protein
VGITQVAAARLFILLLAVAAVVELSLLLKLTPLGRRIRSVVQNRDLAETVGISTRSTDRLTFFIGSGLAGIGLLAVSSGFGDQIGVDPAWRVDEGVMVSLGA